MGLTDGSLPFHLTQSKEVLPPGRMVLERYYNRPIQIPSAKFQLCAGCMTQQRIIDPNADPLNLHLLSSFDHWAWKSMTIRLQCYHPFETHRCRTRFLEECIRRWVCKVKHAPTIEINHYGLFVSTVCVNYKQCIVSLWGSYLIAIEVRTWTTG